MKTLIIDIDQLNDEILTLLTTKFPDGYLQEDIFSHKKDDGKQINVVEVSSGNMRYLIKSNLKLAELMRDYDMDDGYDYIP